LFLKLWISLAELGKLSAIRPAIFALRCGICATIREVRSARLALIIGYVVGNGDDGEGCGLPPATSSMGGVMPIRGALQTRAFGPEDIEIITAAFEDALRQLKLVDRSDPLTEIVAKKMIEIAEQGERDPLPLGGLCRRIAFWLSG
jgi:hypothetical protein